MRVAQISETESGSYPLLIREGDVVTVELTDAGYGLYVRVNGTAYLHCTREMTVKIKLFDIPEK